MTQIVRVPSAYSSIQEGIDAAKDGDTVLVADGTYYENIDFKGKAILLSSHYLLDKDTSHIINTVIRGGQSKAVDTGSVVRFVSGEDSTSILSGFTINRGTGTVIMFDFPVRTGGGILCYQSGAKIINNRILGNTIYDPDYAFGGGISCFGSLSSWIVITGNLIEDNSCDGAYYYGYGGGIYTESNARVENNRIRNNRAISEYYAKGGGAYFGSFGPAYTIHFKNNILDYNTMESKYYARGGAVSVVGCAIYCENNTIIHNSGNGYFVYGAGIFFEATPESKGSYFDSNVLAHNYLGGLIVSAGSAFGASYPDAAVIFTNNEVYSNMLDQEAGTELTFGTIYVYDAFDSEVLIDGNIIYNNSGNYAGGFYSRNTYNLQLTNNAFRNNSAGNRGGGIMVVEFNSKSQTPEHVDIEPDDSEDVTPSRDSDYQPVVANNTFAHNAAGDEDGGGAIYVIFRQTPVITFNNIFWNNADSSGYNDIRNIDYEMYIGSSIINNENIVGDWDGHNNFYEDPMLKNDSTDLMFGSPAIDAGKSYVSHGGIVYDCPEYDYDDQERPLGEEIDIGADEKMPLPETPEALDPSFIGDSHFVAEWYSADYAEGYQLDVAYDVDFKDMVDGYDSLDVGDVQSHSVTGLLPRYDYYYRVRAYNESGVSDHSNVIMVIYVGAQESAYSKELLIYPNPVRNNAQIFFTLPDPSTITIQLYDMKGSTAIVVSDEYYDSGSHAIPLETSDLATGIYHLKLISNDQSITTKIVKHD
jgi:hypothetical protein